MNRIRKIVWVSPVLALALIAGLWLWSRYNNPALTLRIAANAGDYQRVESLLRRYPQIINRRETRWLDSSAMAWTNAPQDHLTSRLLFSKYTVHMIRAYFDTESETPTSQGPVVSCGFGLEEVNGATALHQAALLGNEKVVELLLRGGADPNIADRIGATPLFYAVWTEQERIVKMLLASGAKAGLRDNAGISALEHARLRRNEGIKQMLEAAADSEAKEKTGPNKIAPPNSR